MTHSSKTEAHDLNPYATPHDSGSSHPTAEVCVRRIDVMCIVAVLAAVVVGSFVSIGIPSVREIMMPRFGWGGLTLLLFPLNFLGLYLWKPAPRLLALSGFMFLVVAALNAYAIFRTGTVDTVSNAFHDRLPSSYAWSVYPVLALGLYLCWVGWLTRSHVAPVHS